MPHATRLQLLTTSCTSLLAPFFHPHISCFPTGMLCLTPKSSWTPFPPTHISPYTLHSPKLHIPSNLIYPENPLLLTPHTPLHPKFLYNPYLLPTHITFTSNILNATDIPKYHIPFQHKLKCEPKRQTQTHKYTTFLSTPHTHAIALDR